MTFIAGFKTLTSVHLFADSVITSEGDTALDSYKGNKISSFGEMHVTEDTQIRHSYGFKLLELTPNVVVAYAGDVRVANDYLKDLAPRLVSDDPGQKNIDIIVQLLNEYGKRSKEIALIFGIRSIREFHLLAFNDDGTSQVLLCTDYVFAGNITEDFKIQSTSIARKIYEMNLKDPLPDEVLSISFCSCLHSCSARSYTLEKGFGGVYSGLWITKQETKWYPQTLYVLYPNKYESLATGIRIIQTITPEKNTRLTVNFSVDGGDVRASIECLVNFLSRRDQTELKFDVDSYKFVSFLNTTVAYIHIVSRKVLDSTNQFYLKFHEDGYHLKIEPMLMEHLLQFEKQNLPDDAVLELHI
jgi:hypothetical protein